MKGNCIVRKMRKLMNEEQKWYETEWKMEQEGATRKEFNRFYRRIQKLEKKSKNIWLHNIPFKARNAEYNFFPHAWTYRAGSGQ